MSLQVICPGVRERAPSGIFQPFARVQVAEIHKTKLGRDLESILRGKSAMNDNRVESYSPCRLLYSLSQTGRAQVSYGGWRAARQRLNGLQPTYFFRDYFGIYFGTVLFQPSPFVKLLLCMRQARNEDFVLLIQVADHVERTNLSAPVRRVRQSMANE